MKASIQDQLAKASKDLMLAEPFYGLFLIMLNKKFDDAIGTAGVSRNGINYQLTIAPKFWETLNMNQCKGLLKHELLHIGFGHVTDFDHLSNQDIANLAMDIEINQYIVKEWLPPGPQLPESYPELNLEAKKGTQYYYDKLLQGAKQGNCPNLNQMLAAMAAKKATVTFGDGSEQSVPDHSSWKEFDGLTEGHKELLKSQIQHVLNEVADQVNKSRGTIPSEFAEILKKINEVEPAKFDWKGYLRRFTGGSQKIFTKKSRRKYNKRYSENPGLKIKPKRHILFAIDTSGSVSTNELKECLNELYHIQKTGTEITIVQCDAAISNISPFNHRQDFKIHGRGGTDFQPVIDYYNGNTHKYTCLVYFTDGEAPAPTPARGRILWVLSSQSPMNDKLPGLVIKLN